MSLRSLVPRLLLGVAAPSGTGKTTLLEGVVAALTAEGLRVACLKHHHQGRAPLALDTPGKDSWRLRQAGAWRALVASADQHGVFSASLGAPGPHRLTLDHLQGADVVLVEGFRAAGLPTLLLHRHDLPPPPPDWPPPAQVCAVVTSDPALLRRSDAAPPFLPLDDPPAVARWIVQTWGLKDALSSPPLTVAWLQPEAVSRTPLRQLVRTLRAQHSLIVPTLWDALVSAPTPEVLVLTGEPAQWPLPAVLHRMAAAAPPGCDAVELGPALLCGPRCLPALHASRLQAGPRDDASWRRWLHVHRLGASDAGDA